MKIIIAKSAGFCMGVRHAINKIVTLISPKKKSYIYGELIHNPQVTEILTKRGLIQIENINSAKDKDVAIRTHGIPHKELLFLYENSSKTTNLTCSKVSLIQSIIRKHSRQGYFTLITGKPGHAEVESLKSYAENGCFIIKDENSLKDIPDAKKYIMISQTTFSIDFFKRIKNTLKRSDKNIKFINTICPATETRQEEMAKTISEDKIDRVIVVGGKNSSNTKSLVKISRDRNIKTLHIENPDELNKDQFNKSDSVFITAGASTPGFVINNTIDRLYDIKLLKLSTLFYGLKKIIHFLMDSSIFYSFYGALFLYAFSSGMKITALLSYTLSCSGFFLISKYLSFRRISTLNIKVSRLLIKPCKRVFIAGITILITSIVLRYHTLPLKHYLVLITIDISFLILIIFKEIFKIKVLSLIDILKSFYISILTISMLYLNNKLIFKMEFLIIGLLIFSILYCKNLIIDFYFYEDNLILNIDSIFSGIKVRYFKRLLLFIILVGVSSLILLGLLAGFNFSFLILFSLIYYIYKYNIFNEMNYIVPFKFVFQMEGVILLNLIIMLFFK